MSSPRAALRAYAEALADGRADDAYRWLSDDARRSVSLEAFRTLVKKNRAEAMELGRNLGRPSEEPYITAVIPLDSGEQLLLVLEDGQWRVDPSVLDFYSQATPKLALVGFIRAFRKRRYDVLLRYTPESHRDGLSLETLQAAWAEGKPEARLLEKKLEEIRQALATAAFEETGDRATMTYGSSGSVLFLREQGLWKIEDVR